MGLCRRVIEGVVHVTSLHNVQSGIGSVFVTSLIETGLGIDIAETITTNSLLFNATVPPNLNTVNSIFCHGHLSNAV